MPPRSEGRMIRRDINCSRKFAMLGPEAAALFCMLIPCLNAYGKMKGDLYFVKGEVCPLVPWLDLPTIEAALTDISKHTSVKWFEFQGLMYIHATKWEEHQKFQQNRRGADLLPSYSVKRSDNSESTPRDIPEDSKLGLLPVETGTGTGSGTGSRMGKRTGTGRGSAEGEGATSGAAELTPCGGSPAPSADPGELSRAQEALERRRKQLGIVKTAPIEQAVEAEEEP